MASSYNHQSFTSYSRVSQSLCNDRCQTILYKAVFEHLEELPIIAALLLTSKSFQNSSFGANFIVNYIVNENSIRLLYPVLAPSSCFSVQFVPSLYIRQWWTNSDEVNRKTSNFARELVKSKYFHLSLRSLTVDSVSTEIVCLFFGSSTSNASWPQLQDLTLNNCGLDDIVVKNISKTAANLRSVNLSGSSGVTDIGLEHISNLSDVTFLNLGGCNEITDIGLEHASTIPDITFIDLAGCKQITDAGLHHISNLRHITSLNLCRCNLITDLGIDYVSSCVNITSLDLFCCDKITDVSLRHISTLSGITSLNLYGCNKITDAGLEHVAKLSRITWLRVWGCDKITEEAKQKFKTELPNCKIY